MSARLFVRISILTQLLVGGILYGGGPDDSPVPVVVAPVELVHETAPKRYVGFVESIHHVDVMPRVTGTLLKIHFQEGALVKEGALLYELEDTTYHAAVEGLTAQREQLQAALEFADAEYKRSKDLISSNIVARSSFEKAVLEINSAKAKIRQIVASLTDAENNLSYTKIYAPQDGRIGKSRLTKGNLVTPQNGKLNDIEQIAPIYVRFSVSERVFRRDFGGMAGIQENAVVRVQLADDSEYPESARVTLVDNKINAGTNTITLWATFENKDHGLLPGGFVTVLLSVKNGKKLPAIIPSALLSGEDGYFVYVLAPDHRVVRRGVKIGSISMNKQIITSGLDGSEQVIVDGTHKVKPGMTVIPVEAQSVK